MSNRSRAEKLLSPTAVPKVEKPAPVEHAKREFKLPKGVIARLPSVAALRKQALGMGPRTPAAVPAPQVAAPAAKPAPQSKPALAPSGAASLAPPLPAPPILPKLPVPMPAPANLLSPTGPVAAAMKWPAIGTPAPRPFADGSAASAPLPMPFPAPGLPAPADLVPARTPRASSPPPIELVVKKAAPPPIELVVKKAPLPPPLPPPPITVQPSKPVDAPRFRERTNMWFKAGEAIEQEALELEASTVLKKPFWRAATIVAAAGGLLGLAALLTLV